GKENGVNIIQSIDNGPYQMGTTRDTLGTANDGGVTFGIDIPRIYNDLDEHERKRFDANIRAALKGYPKTSINSSTTTQKLNQFGTMMIPGENITNYYVRFHKLVNDIRNIKMTMPNIQLNSKFVNNMTPEWDRFVTAVKLNKGLKETNHEQLYAYLKQQENHAAYDRLINSRFNPTTNDPLALPLHVHTSQNPYSVKNSQLDTGYTPTGQMIDNLSNQIALLAQQFRATLSQTNNQLRTSSNTSTAGSGNAQNRAGNANQGQGKPIKCYSCGGFGHIARNCEQANTYDANVNDQPVHDMAQNDSNIFLADDCDAFDSDIDDEPITQTIFMANLSLLHNEESVVPIGASSVQYDDYMLHENSAYVPDDSFTTTLNIYKDQVAIYEQRAKFKLTDCEQKMDDQMRMLIQEQIAETTRQKMSEKINDPESVAKRVKIIPPNYSKENFLATFTPQTQLTSKQVFWSLDLEKRKAKELKANTPPLRKLAAATVYPPNTPAHLVPRTLPTKCKIVISIFVLNQLFADFDKTCTKRITPRGLLKGKGDLSKQNVVI
nr:hypothetical protein [Tanacetum cinerariifolium]